MNRVSIKQRGFTIVELLVVIVVIAILAGITLVSYSWVTKDAQSAKLATTASQYVRALDIYKTKNGTYPVATTTSCLGSYPSIANSASGICYTAGGYVYASYNSTVNSNLASVGISEPLFTDLVSAGTYYFRGIRYYSDGRTYNLYWEIKGNYDCGAGASGSYSSANDYTSCYKNG